MPDVFTKKKRSAVMGPSGPHGNKDAELGSANIFHGISNPGRRELLAITVNELYIRRQFNPRFFVQVQIRAEFGAESGNSLACAPKIHNALVFVWPNFAPVNA